MMNVSRSVPFHSNTNNVALLKFLAWNRSAISCATVARALELRLIEASRDDLGRAERAESKFYGIEPIWLALFKTAVFSNLDGLACPLPLFSASSTRALIAFICAFRSASCAFSIAFLASLYSLIRCLPREPCRRLSSAFRRSGSWIIAEKVSKTFLVGTLWRSATSAKGKRSWQVSAISTILQTHLNKRRTGTRRIGPYIQIGTVLATGTRS